MRIRSACFQSTIRMVFAVAVVAGLAAGCQTPTASDSAAETHDAFDEQRGGKELVQAALERARTENKQVVLLFGANWCPYCRQLHALLETDPAVSALVRQSFVVVPIDVGTSTRNRNTGLIDRYGATVFTDGVPSVVIIDAGGRRLAPTKDNPWTAKDRIEAGRVMNFLKRAGG